MNAKKPHSDGKKTLRAIVMGAAGKPEIHEQAELLRAEIANHVEVVKSDFSGNEDMSGVEADLAVVLGGDGSILRAARQMGHHQLPVVAVNLGKLGFLANISPTELPSVLSDYKAGVLNVSEHLMLECSHIREGAVQSRQLGLNEVAIQGGTSFSPVSVNLYVDSELATTYSGDGLIIATPIGSTAHSLSSGGPILRQTLHAFVIVPISAHTLTHRPVVDADGCVYELEVPQPNHGTSAIVDGRLFRELQPGDLIRVEKSRAKFKLVAGRGHSYYRTLREKLGWGGQLKLNR